MSKKIVILGAILGLFVGGSVTYGAIQIKSLKWYDFIAQIETQNQGNIYINKFEDAGNTCYVMTNDYTVNTRVNGANIGISCVNSVVKK